ncbi:hypothetical protein PIB30_050595 [Stylosanthes scabra]|uniref:Uncharacterized protein n=1 Tax=Stylosanthes scabra TaxID=79078 RepID=A0ABU6VG64_9FABA|nr:hypothetical protein [Stylosanthes scabra]
MEGYGMVGNMIPSPLPFIYEGCLPNVQCMLHGEQPRRSPTRLRHQQNGQPATGTDEVACMQSGYHRISDQHRLWLMADPLLELEEVVLFKREKLTAEETNFLRSWKNKALGDFAITGLAGGAATWAATWKLKKSSRVQLSAAAGIALGQWILMRSVYSSADQILSMHGSILQKELANLLVF